MTSLPYRRCLLLLTVLAAACAPTPPAATTPAADSAAARARADSLAAATRRDSLRADSLARARADSVARSATVRADSVRAQILRDSADAAARLMSGLSPAADSELSQPVRFALDQSELSPEARALLDRKIVIMRSFPRLEVMVEGHADERGPDEYNLALANRRAAAVKRYLVEHGLPDARLTIASYGEERPADPRSNEQAWAANRRAEFRVTRSAR